jgi:hypothetical protein
MQIGRCGVWAALLLAGSAAAGCAGNGEGLNANGEPVAAGGAPSGSITADLQSIQDNVFTPICAQCHIGASAPEGLQLDAAHSYDLLVGIPSNEQPNLLRVKPGDPDDSYMVHKIEGLAGIDGGQMPLGETPLPQATIDAIRQWIANGAPNVPALAPAAQPAFAVQATAPVDRAVVKAPLARILVIFTREVDATLVDDTTVALQRLDPAAPGADSPSRVAATAARVAQNGAVVMITPRAPLDSGTYRVVVRGSGAAALADMNARTLGTDTTIEFTVESAP